MSQVPTKTESERYYYGLYNPTPKLLARTSNTEWEPTEREKVLYTAPNNNRLALDVEAGKLTVELTNALEAADPASAMVVRIGYCLLPGEVLRAPTILLVGVRTESGVEPEAALKAANNCKKFLEENDYGDIDVEICQTKTGYPSLFLPPIYTA